MDLNPATPLSTQISGTAAVGLALANATVDVKCASGSGTGTTGADGKFSVTIANAVRPCVLSVQVPGGTTLHSVVESGTGATVVANISPLTELVAASIAGGSTDAFFANFDAQAQAKLTPAAVSASLSGVALALSGIVDLTNVDPLKDDLVAANGSTTGNALDQKLDALGTALAAAQTSLADLSSAVAANTGAPSAVATILQPASSHCSALRSGDYHGIGLGEAGVERVRVDAASLTATWLSNSVVHSLVPDAERCSFTVTVGGETVALVVAKSGIIVMRGAASENSLPGLLVPEQSIPLSELAGNWNGLFFDREPSLLVPGGITFTVDAAGKFTAGADCSVTSCEAWPADELGAFTVHPDGGFDLYDGDSMRTIAFKAADGNVAMVVFDEAGFFIASKQMPATLPAVGARISFWDLGINASGVATMGALATLEVTAVDSAANTYTRQRLSDGRLETWETNKPWDGIRHRLAGTSPVNGGGTVNVPEIVSLQLLGTGIVVSTTVNPARFFSVSVEQPPRSSSSANHEKAATRPPFFLHARSWSLIGKLRMRLPVAAKIALASAGAIGGTPGSPDAAERRVVVARDQVHDDLLRRGVHAQHLELVEVVLLRAAVLEGDLARERVAEAHHAGALHLRAHALGVDDGAAVDRDVDPRDRQLAVRVHRHLDHRRHVGGEAVVRGDAQAPALAQRLAPARASLATVVGRRGAAGRCRSGRRSDPRRGSRCR